MNVLTYIRDPQPSVQHNLIMETSRILAIIFSSLIVLARLVPMFILQPVARKVQPKHSLRLQFAASVHFLSALPCVASIILGATGRLHYMLRIHILTLALFIISDFVSF
jgi:hypothetical protein